VRTVTILLLLGVLIGVGVGPIFYFSDWLMGAWLLTGLLAIALWFRRTPGVGLGVVLVIGMVCGNWRFGLTQLPVTNDISRQADQVSYLVGVVASDPEPRGADAQFIVAVQASHVAASVAGLVLVTTRAYPPLRYGNQVKLTGSLQVPTASSDFDYPAYLSRFGVQSLMRYPQTQILEDFVGNPILGWLYGVKSRLLVAINHSLPEPAAGLLAGLLLGIRSSLPADLLDSFNTVGLTHIIALSGFNITIIAGALMSWLMFLPVRWRMGLAIVAIMGFVMLTGASPSITRAAMMGILVLVAGLTGRVQDVGVSLLVAAGAMVLHNPLVLHYDVGFQLSFLSTIGIIYLQPIAHYYLVRGWKFWRDHLIPTLSALVFVTPVIVYHFERVSLIAPLANVLVLPVIPLTMGLGFLAATVGWMNGTLGVYAGLVAWWPLQFIIGVATYLSHWPWATVAIQSHSLIGVALYYLGLIGLLTIWYRRHVANQAKIHRPGPASHR